MKKKIFALGLLTLALSIVFAASVSAEFWACFDTNTVVDYCDYRPHGGTYFRADETCDDSFGCTRCMSLYDETLDCFVHGSWPKCIQLPQECSAGSGTNTTIDSQPPELTLNSPLPDNSSIFSSSSVQVDFELNEESHFYYMDLLDGRERYVRICNECIGSQTKNVRFDEGLNKVRFKAEDVIGNFVEIDVEFYIDSSDPRITSTTPGNGFADGTFTVEFDEDNPEVLTLHYGSPVQTQVVDTNTCVENRGRQLCTTSVDLSSFDGQDIDYYFTLTDIAGGLDTSRVTTISVDATAPIIDDLSYSQNGRNVDVVLTLTEQNFDSAEYLDSADSSGRWKSLCSRLSGNLCEGRISVADGPHTIVFNVSDEAGNYASDEISFFADSKEPKISGTSPTRGFADGNFVAEVDEANPVSLYLNYGNDVTGFRSEHVDLNTCTEARRGIECPAFVDLADYNGQDIDYWFNITDIIEQTAVSKVSTLSVDTTAPIINDLSYTQNGRNVEVVMDITEQNFESALYLDVDSDRPRWKSLCSRLSSEGLCEGRVSVDDGPHTVVFNVSDEAGNWVSDEISFFADSKVPKISGTDPTRGFADGNFYATVDEANPVSLYLNYGNVGTGFRSAHVDLNTCTEGRRGIDCGTFVDLSDYHGEEIEYSFNVTDILEQTAESRVVMLDVDTVAPVINSLNYTIDGRRVTFFIDITEDNFDSVEYIDNSAASPRFRPMCTRLTDGMCEKTLTFTTGHHDLSIQVTDDAGWAVGQNVAFDII